MFSHSEWKSQPLVEEINIRLLCVALITSLGAMGFGFDNGWWGSALGLTEFKRKYGAYSDANEEWAISGQLVSAATGTGSAGIILGCILAPALTSKLGRKPTFLVMSVIKIVGITLEVTAMTSFWQLVVGRIIVYCAIGISSNVVPMYQSECAPARIRGAFLALYSFFTSFGQFMATLTVYLSQNRADKWQYLIVMVLQYFVPLGYICMYALIPESPRYLIYSGKYREAEDVMRQLYNNKDSIPEEVRLLKLQVEEQHERHRATTILDCFRATNIKRTIPAIGVQVLQQAQGVSFIQNYAVTFMQELGFQDTLRSAIMITGCGFAVHIVTFLTFDKIGRRTSMISGALGLAAMMIGVGITTSVSGASLSASAQNACVAMLILWYCIFGFTWGPGAWVVCAEIGTGQLRERTLFLASMGSFLTSVPINFVNPYVQEGIGGKVTFIYGGFSLLALVFVFSSVPETKNRSLEELDEMFQNNVPIRKFRDYVASGLGSQQSKLEEKLSSLTDNVKVEHAGSL